MSKRLVLSMVCLAACFSVGTWAAYELVFSPAPKPGVVEVVEPTEKISEAPATKLERTSCSEDIQHVSFQGVSFDFDRCAFGVVTAEEVSEQRLQAPTDKPDSVWPTHISFDFEVGPKYWEPTLAVYPIAEIPRMYSVNRKLERGMRDEIKDLERVLKDKNFRDNGEIPYLQFVDGGQEFQTNVKLVKFENGRGIFFVTYISIEAILVGNDHLRYIFEGITDDGKYILAEMPIRAPFLKDESPEEFEGYNVRFLMEDTPPNEVSPRYKRYISSITKRLEAMRPEEFQPDLRKLEDVIASLKINK